MRPGKARHDDFTTNRQIQLVCMRGKDGVYGPLKFGVEYQFVDDGAWVAVVPVAAP